MDDNKRIVSARLVCRIGLTADDYTREALKLFPLEVIHLIIGFFGKVGMQNLKSACLPGKVRGPATNLFRLRSWQVRGQQWFS